MTRAIFERMTWNSVCEGLLPLTVYVDHHRLLGGCAFINPGCFLGTGEGWSSTEEWETAGVCLSNLMDFC